MQNPWHAVLDLQVGQEQCCWQVPCITVCTIAGIEHLHVTSHVQVVVYSLGLTVLIYGTLAYLRIKLFLKTKLTDAE